MSVFFPIPPLSFPANRDIIYPYRNLVAHRNFQGENMFWFWFGLGLLAVVISIIVSAIVSSGFYFFRRVFLRADKTPAAEEKAKARLEKQGHPEIYPMIEEGKKYMASLPSVPVELTSFDGLTLRARYYKNPAHSGTTVLLSHGYKSYPEYDFGAVCSIYWERGCDLLVPWSRAHMESDGRFTTLGAFEKRDLLDWCLWLEKQVSPEEKIVLAGMSMGSTVSLLAASDGRCPKNVCGVIADCGFISIRREICDILKVVGFPKFPIVWSGGIISRMRLGVSLDDFSTVDEVKKLTLPVLFIHGEADTFVLPDSSEKNFAACASQNKTLVTVPGAQHCYAFHTDRELVSKSISDFLDRL